MAASSPSPAVKLLFPTVALVGSVAVTIVGAVLTSSASTTLTNALTNPAAATTAADVYGSQSAIQIFTGILIAGIVGVFVSLAAFAVLVGLGAFSSPADEPAPLADEDGDLADLDELDVAPVDVAPVAAAPAVAEVVEDAPVAEAVEATEAVSAEGAIDDVAEAAAAEADVDGADTKA